MSVPADLKARFEGSILGLAIGDALGHPTEFMGHGAIRARYGERGITHFDRAGKHPPGTFTDDTQMSIAVARALIRAGHEDLETLMGVLAREFVAWHRSSENDRAPGNACMSGCRNLARGTPWRAAGARESKGCGAAMRAAPIGLFYVEDEERLVEVAAAQSLLTHGHPTAVASSVAAASAVAWAARGEDMRGVFRHLRETLRLLTEERLLAMGCHEGLVTRFGAREMEASLAETESLLHEEDDDVCSLLGGAWVGEEAVACGLWCAQRAGHDFLDSVRRGASSSGDSDSVACIAGSITGAHVGLHELPAEMVRGVEKSDLLLRLAGELYVASRRERAAGPLPPDLDFFGAEGEVVRPDGPGDGGPEPTA